METKAMCKARDNKTNGSSIRIPKNHAKWYELTEHENGTLTYTPVRS